LGQAVIQRALPTLRLDRRWLLATAAVLLALPALAQGGGPPTIPGPVDAPAPGAAAVPDATPAPVPGEIPAPVPGDAPAPGTQDAATHGPGLPTTKPPALERVVVALPTDKPPPLEPPRQVLVVEAPTTKPPPLERGPADIPGPACDAEHHQPLIDEALAMARSRIRDAIRLVQDEPDHAHIRRWFGTAPRKTIRITLELTAARLDDMAAVTIRCNDPPDCPGGRFAYANERNLILGLCPPFFRARMDGTDSRWGILIHEASHLAANTRDHAYRPTGALRLAKDNPARAAENADNYEYFVETLPH
jgi:peptidyl-Lys metalloendopeptidase